MRRQLQDVIKISGIIAAISIISVLHFGTSTHHRPLHEIYQRLYYIPILLAAYWYGPVAGFLTAAATSVIYIIHIERDWSHFPDYTLNQYAEIFLYHALALLTGFLALRDRKRRQNLERTSRELSQAYDRLRQTFDQLKQADRLASLGQLSAGIAHEIRNPLSSIKGSIEILEGEIPQASSKREFLKIIKEETARLNQIVAEFLKFARPPKPLMEQASVNELVESTLILLQKEAQQSGVEIRTELDERLPLVQLDRDQMRQVLLNIMLNGIQAMPGGGTLVVRTAASNVAREVGIEISDTGEGIAESDMDRIFDPFFTTKSQGSGLGLAISYQLVQSHGGRIEVRRNAAEGMTFRIELPIMPMKPTGIAAPGADRG